MARDVTCPGCGGPQALRHPGITSLACRYCGVTLYWNEAAILSVGERSVLPEGDTRLGLGATGRLDGRLFEVLGHVVYDHGRGRWDEWYLAFDGGADHGWVNEDERQLQLERPLTGPAPDVASLPLGARATLDGAPMTVRERLTARCAGVEGQLPFVVLPGHERTFVDLASQDGAAFGSVETTATGERRGYLGRPVSHAELVLDAGLPQPAPTSDAATVNCASCSGDLAPPRDRKVRTIVCRYCGANCELEGAAARVIGQNPKQPPPFALELGAEAQFDGVSYLVCGRSMVADRDGYPEHVYLLYHRDRGYLYLENEDREWSLSWATDEAPDRDPFGLKPGETVRVGADAFQLEERGSSTVRWVDGAFPWLVKVGDEARWADLEGSAGYFCAETDGREVEYSRGRAVKKQELKRALGEAAAPKGAGPKPVPNRPSPGWGQAAAQQAGRPDLDRVKKPWWRFW